jgi:hypothetical protein
MATTPPPCDASVIQNALALLCEPGQVVELRCVNYEETPSRGKRSFTGTLSGYFDDFATLAREAAQASPRAKGTYITLNPVDPSLLARQANRTALAKEAETTADTKILRRRWLPLDFDPVRDPHRVCLSNCDLRRPDQGLWDRLS